MEYDYYTRFQRAVARSLQWEVYDSNKVYLYTDFLQKQENVFLAPLSESVHILERRLIEFFSINMVATKRGVMLNQADYEDLRKDARMIALPDIFQAMQKYPLTVATMLYYLFQEDGKESPVLITIGNVLNKEGTPYAPQWNNTKLAQYRKQSDAERDQKLSVWLTFRDGTLLNPTLKLTNHDAQELPLLYVIPMNDANSFIFDPLLVGGSTLMQIFGNC